jgi:hypothetical protein
MARQLDYLYQSNEWIGIHIMKIVCHLLTEVWKSSVMMQICTESCYQKERRLEILAVHFIK